MRVSISPAVRDPARALATAAGRRRSLTGRSAGGTILGDEEEGRMNNDKPLTDGMIRPWVAIAMVVGTFGAIVALAIANVVIVWRTSQQPEATANAISGIFDKLLPLLGTWIGTVTAYYFSKENLAAATSSVSAMARHLTSDDKLRATPAKDKMIPRSR